MSNIDFLTTRTTERQDVFLPGEFEVIAESGMQVSFASRAPGQRSDRCIAVTVVDLATGGMGLHTETYLPRGTRGIVRLQRKNTETGLTEPIERVVEIKRAKMVTRQPLYTAGAAFTGLDGFSAQEIQDMVQAVTAPQAAGSASPGGDA